MISKLKSHYPVVDLWLTISLMVAFAAIVGNIAIESNIMQAEIEAEQYSMENGCSMKLQDMEFSELKVLIGAVGEIARLEDVNLMLNDASTSCLSEVFLYGDISKWYPLIEGRYPTSEELEEHVRVALIGKNHAKEIYERETNDYIMIESEEYLVTGIVGTTKSNLWANTILLFVDSLGENVLVNFSNWNSYEVYIESQEQDARRLYQQVWMLFDEKGISARIDVQETYLKNYEKNRRTEEIPSLLLFAFCMVEAILVSEVWIYQRMPELVIRKTFGYTNLQLALYLVREILKSLILTLLLISIGLVISNMLGWLSLNLSFVFVIMMLGMAVFVGGVVIGYPIYYVSHLSEWQLLKKIG